MKTIVSRYTCYEFCYKYCFSINGQRLQERGKSTIKTLGLEKYDVKELDNIF